MGLYSSAIVIVTVYVILCVPLFLIVMFSTANMEQTFNMLVALATAEIPLAVWFVTLASDAIAVREDDGEEDEGGE